MQKVPQNHLQLGDQTTVLYIETVIIKQNKVNFQVNRHKIQHNYIV